MPRNAALVWTPDMGWALDVTEAIAVSVAAQLTDAVEWNLRGTQMIATNIDHKTLTKLVDSVRDG